ncbi:hypothetical protein HX792_10345 [Pseudomonas sp. B6002]|uniref:hypothetical protein n=1 Tax=Pseudomonas sp. B6002 TaxID=2726978 RepID=UPI0015A366B1|nr:hypothetical protein [Pseudomonas sp. B6002]NVZ50735.1 hypothetical protein [Pseudomonas sp. B6002]
MTLRLLPASLLFACTLTHAAENPVPQPVAEQVGRLVELLKDGFASGYPEATQVQDLNVGTADQLTLAVFTVEGFDKGNTYRQYIAAFTPAVTEDDQEHYTLVDVMHIGGDGWRAVETLDAKWVKDPAHKRALIDIPVMENASGDSPNFPSQPGVIHLALIGDESKRFVEKD